MILTASRTDLALRCAYPFRGDIHVARSESDAAAQGTREHALIEATLAAGEHAPEQDTSETHALWVAEWHERERGRGWRPEVAIALDPRTGETRLVDRAPDGHRDYSAIPLGFVAGTADAIRVEHGLVEVADWKTGQAAALARREIVRGADGRPTVRTVGWRRPSEMGQMLTLGAAFARHYRAPLVTLHLVPANERRLHVESERVGLLELRLHEQRLAAVLDEAAGDAQPRPGPHCSELYCPLLGHCPATRAALSQTAPATALGPYMLATHSSDFVSPEHLWWQWHALDAAEERLAAGRLAARVALRERFPGRGPAGETLALEPQRRETIDASAPGLVAALEARGLGAAVEWVPAKPRVTKETIYAASKPGVDAAKAAAREAGGPVRGLSYAAARDAAVADLALIGAVKVSEYEVPRVVPARAAQAGGPPCDWCGRVHDGGPERCGPQEAA